MDGAKTSRTRGRSGTGGFTLLETLLAGFVLAVSAVALASTLAQSKRLADRPRDEMVARGAMQSVFAEIAATPFPQVAPTYENAGFAVPGLRAPPGDADGLPGEVRVEYGPYGNTSFYTVTLRVRWMNGAQVRTVESVRFVSNVRGDTGAVPPLVGTY